MFVTCRWSLFESKLNASVFFPNNNNNITYRFVCVRGQIPVCSECMLCLHKMPEHTCERIVDVEGRLLDEMRGIVTETKEKIKSCEAASTDLESVLSELQQQRDNASDLIKESYHSYKSMLEKRQVT